MCKRGHVERNRFGQCVECVREARRRYRGKACGHASERDSFGRCRECAAEARRKLSLRRQGLCKRGHTPPKRNRFGQCVECMREIRRGCAVTRQKPEMCELGCDRPAEHLDHDHTTGTFRGWLCKCCNPALGMFLDNPALLRRAAAYIELGGLPPRGRRKKT